MVDTKDTDTKHEATRDSAVGPSGERSSLPAQWEEALRMASLGWPIFPVQGITTDGQCTCGKTECVEKGRAGKHPVTKHGKDDATTDLDTILDWAAQYPWANIAVALPEGVLVIDLDIKPGKHGDELWARILRETALPQDDVNSWPRTKTGSGGLHYWLRIPEDMLQERVFRTLDGRAGQDKAELQRGGKHYVIIPPSRHLSGGQYEWLLPVNCRPEELPPIPYALYPYIFSGWKKEKRERRKKLVSKAKRVQTEKDLLAPWWVTLWRYTDLSVADIQAMGVLVGDPTVDPMLLQVLEREPGENRLKVPVTTGSRDNLLTAIRGYLYEVGLDDEQVVKILDYVNQQHCHPPLDRDVEEFRNRDWEPVNARWPNLDLEQLVKLPTEQRPALDIVPYPVVAKAAKAADERGYMDLARYLQRWRQHLRGSRKASGGTWIREEIDDAPIPENLTLPEGWAIKGRIIGRYTIDPQTGEPHFYPVVPKPILISGVYDSIHSNAEWVELVWETAKGTWKKEVVPRGVIADRAKLLQMADRGAVVDSNMVRGVIKWLTDLLLENQDKLESGKVVTHGGHVGIDGVYLYGTEPIGKVSEKIRPALPDGVSGYLKAIETVGSWEEEQKVWRMLLERYPDVWAVVAASLSAPLLHWLPESDTWILHLYGSTSTGKTRAVRMAIGAWGTYFDASGRGLLRTWDATARAIERLRTACNGIPVYLDDTAVLGTSKTKQSMLDAVVYAASSGASRGRARRGGDDIQTTFLGRTVIISTGEGPLGETGSLGGVAARVVDIGIPLWGATSQQIAEDQQQLLSILEANHGHLARKFVLALLEDYSPDTIRSIYHAYLGLLMGLAKEAKVPPQMLGVTRRKAQYLATVMTANHIAVEDVLEDDCRPGEEAVGEWFRVTIQQQAGEGTPSQQWLDDLVSIILSEPGRVWRDDRQEESRTDFDALRETPGNSTVAVDILEETFGRKPKTHPMDKWWARFDPDPGLGPEDWSGSLYIIQPIIPKLTDISKSAMRAHRENLVQDGTIQTWQAKHRRCTIQGVNHYSWEVRLQDGAPVHRYFGDDE